MSDFERDNTRELEVKMMKTFIIPQYYKPEHFEIMEDWNEGKVDAFKEYMNRIVSSGGGEFINNFITDIARDFSKDVETGEIENDWDSEDEEEEEN